MQNIEVLTAITSDKDFLREDQAWGGARWTCFTDNPNLTSESWHIKPAYDKFKDPRRNSRIHKILTHKYSDADITIWIDGNINLVQPPEMIVDRCLGDYDMAMYKHGSRDCIYDEALECAKLGLDNVETIIEQAKYYEDHEYAKHKGLCSGFFIIRRNNQKTKDFNEAWWADYCRFSRRDQISLMPAVDKVGVRINIMPEKWIQKEGHAQMADIFTIKHHQHFEGNFNQPK